MKDEIKQLKAEVCQVAKQFGMNEALLPDFSSAVIDRLSLLYGTAKIYIPAQNKKARDQSVMAMFNGTNHREVCLKFNISKSTLYRIVRGVKK